MPSHNPKVFPLFLFLLITLLLTFPTGVPGVSIRNYERRNCQGRFEQCTDANENTCCDRSAGNPNQRPSFESSEFRRLPSSGLGLACNARGRENCGLVVDASWGEYACAGRGSDLAGAFWFSCRGCPFRGGGNGGNGGGGNGGPREQVMELARQQMKDHPPVPVKPDLVGIDGHLFPVNYATPEEITEAVYKAYDAGLGFEDLPQHVLAHEIVNEDPME